MKGAMIHLSGRWLAFILIASFVGQDRSIAAMEGHRGNFVNLADLSPSIQQTDKRSSCTLSEFISISRELGFHQYCEEEAINNTFIEIAQESDGSLKLVNFSQFAVALGNLARKAGIDQFCPRKWRGKKTLLVEELFRTSSGKGKGRTSKSKTWNMPCQHPNCAKMPSFGTAESKVPSYCREHCPREGYYDTRGKFCRQLGCKSHASFRHVDGVQKLFCAKHRPPGSSLRHCGWRLLTALPRFVTVNRLCGHIEGCDRQCSFGDPEEKIPRFCHIHKRSTDCLLKKRRCRHPEGCDAQPIFNASSTCSSSFCKLHKSKTVSVSLLRPQRAGRKCARARGS